MMQLFHDSSYECSKIVTNKYSTSFSLGIKALDKRFHKPIYGIYGYVRFADEIVDTFHDWNKSALLEKFRKDTYQAIEEGISLNPILHSFQEVVRKYSIPMHLIDAFLDSMEMDLEDKNYNNQLYDTYIYGSAEVVGLMCLRVFVEGDDEKYKSLVAPARSLGAAFQKVNFLRDMRDDFDERGRVYFPGIDFHNFENKTKKQIEEDISKDFQDAYQGIINLPDGARFGVYLAYVYYLKLFNKIKRLDAYDVLKSRIRVSNPRKMMLLFKSYLNSSMGIY